MKKSIRDFKIDNRKVIIRSDLNVPIKDGKIVDDTRIKKSIETISYALQHNAKVIVLSHLGRIKTEEDIKKNDLKIVAKRLEKYLQQKVIFVSKTRGKEIEEAINTLKNGEILLLQNTRYEDLIDQKESKCDEQLAKYWASLGDIFINDAFGTLHRAHASNVGISKYLPSGIGFLVENELIALDNLKTPEHPFIIILGGGKVQDKIPLIEKLIPICDKLLIGGGMAFTFLKADGYEVGNSLVDTDSLEFCQKILNQYANKIMLPIDIKVAAEFKDIPGKNKLISEIDFNDIGLDIGTNTVELFKKCIKDAKMILWNGPLGVYEFENYAIATNAILTYLSKQKSKAIIAGGDIVAAAQKKKVTKNLYHVSTGGGATLEYLQGVDMPGLKNIEEV